MALVLYTDLKYKRIDCFGVSILQYTGVINEENYPRSLPIITIVVDNTQLKEEQSSANDEDYSSTVKFDLDVEYLKSLDPKSWKDQDHYAVLGLKEGR